MKSMGRSALNSRAAHRASSLRAVGTLFSHWLERVVRYPLPLLQKTPSDCCTTLPSQLHLVNHAKTQRPAAFHRAKRAEKYLLFFADVPRLGGLLSTGPGALAPSGPCTRSCHSAIGVGVLGAPASSDQFSKR